MNTEKLSALLSASVLAAAALVQVLGLNVTPTYSDFIVGSLAWYAGDKFQDLLAWPAFIVVFFLSFIALEKLLSSIRSSYGFDISSRLASQFILWSIPFYANLGALFLGGVIDNKIMATSSLGITFLAIVSYARLKAQRNLDPVVVGMAFLSVVLISLVPIEAVLLLGRASIPLPDDVTAASFRRATYVLIAGGFIGGIFMLLKGKSIPSQRFPKFLLLSQIGLPVFFLTLYPAGLLQPSGVGNSYQTTVYLKVLVVGLVLIGIFDIVNRYRQHVNGSTLRSVISPVALFGLLIALKAGNTVAPAISPDDYHFGESLLGWWSYSKGAVPYVDYIPPHGLVEDDLRQFLSFVFYDGSAASVAEAGRLALALLGFVAFISVYRFSASLALASMVVLLLNDRLAWFFLIPFVCLWLSRSLRAQPQKWLAAWILTCPIVILGVPPQGLLLVAASGLLAGKIAWKQFRTSDMRAWTYVGLVTLLLLLMFAATPLFTMLVGAIRYVLENGPINQIAYGVPWSLSWTSAAPSGFVFEAIRMSWVVIPLACLHVIQQHWRTYKDTQSALYPAAFIFAFSLLLIPYSMGRIDPANVSRPGLASIFLWTAIFPLVAWGLVKIHTRAPIMLLAAFMSSLLGLGSVSFTNLVSAASPVKHVAALRDTAAAGLPNIGTAQVQDTHWDRITRLNALLDSRLEPDETYLDLSSRNAQYFYVDRLPPVPITAPYNLVSPTQQKRAVENLSEPPKIALLQADNITYDGGGIALRNPYLYRFVVKHYTPRLEKGFIVGYRKADVADHTYDTIIAEVNDVTDDNWHKGSNRYKAGLSLSDPTLVSMLQTGDQIRLPNGQTKTITGFTLERAELWLDGDPIPFSDANHTDTVQVLTNSRTVREYVASLLHRSFSVSDLQKIPASWGNSKDSLAGKMALIKDMSDLTPNLHQLSPVDGAYRVDGLEPQLTFDISALGLSGRDIGLLKLDFTCTGKNAMPKLQVFWWGDGRDQAFEQSSMSFTGEDGTLIVPVDASPWWLTLKKIKGIRIELQNAQACHTFSVGQIALYQRLF